MFLFSDSELVIGHLNGSKKVKKPHLKELYSQVKEKEKMFEKVTYDNLPREDPKIERVDKLVNQELDRQHSL